MKPWIFDEFTTYLNEIEIKTLCEIGTHKGNTAVQMILHLAPKVNNLSYIGYDVFDYARNNVPFNQKERNGKGGASKEFVIKRLNKLKESFPNFKYQLHEGLTRDTLQKNSFDFVYIDGGHSYDTVKFDYSCVKNSKLIVFDDAKNKNNANDVPVFLNELSKSVEIEYFKRWAVIRNYA